LSGGCIDADVASQARAALEDGAGRRLRYGAGSPFFDIKLPCGGAIDVVITPSPEATMLAQIVKTLDARASVNLDLAADGALAVAPTAASRNADILRFFYEPKLRLRLAGRGADLFAMARIADAAGVAARVQSPDQECLVDLAHISGCRTDRLLNPQQIPSNDDDPWTAFILLFHDPEWETEILRDALAGDAFYVGAVGSRATHERRKERLAAAGCGEDAIARIHAPVGLVPSMRDASTVAISAFAEIIDVFRKRDAAPG
ncbi:MAG: XdhC family protein, partial [Pseudomonadota bacterium]